MMTSNESNMHSALIVNWRACLPGMLCNLLLSMGVALKWLSSGNEFISRVCIAYLSSGFAS